MTVRIGILGLAHGHVGAYCSKWREKPETEISVVAAWDHDAARAKSAADSFGVHLYDTPKELLERADVNAIAIGAETSMHAELAVLAAQAGKAIIVQKPLALTMEQADQIVEAVTAAGVPFTMAWQMRADPQNIRMKRLIQEGTLGRIVMLRRRHGLGTHVWPGFENTWHVKPELNRGMWADDAAHPIDLVYWLLGKPVSVTAEIDTLVNPKVPDDQGIAIFRYADGAFAEVCCSFTCIAGENTTEIVGEKGVAIQNFGDGPSCGVPRQPNAVGLKWFLHGDKEWVDSGIPSPAGHGERIAGLSEPLLEFLQGKRPPIASVEEGRESLRMLLASYESAKLGRRVIV